jgi:hypothetical protein
MLINFKSFFLITAFSFSQLIRQILHHLWRLVKNYILVDILTGQLFLHRIDALDAIS